MTVNRDLFELIRSLSPSEKRYFKIFASKNTQSSKQNYLKVWEEIDRQGEYDEALVVGKLDDPKLKSQFPVIKHYLYNLVLKSLRNYHSSHSVDFKLKEMLMNVEILQKKDLISQCLKVLDKAQRLASEYERFEYLFEIFSLRISLALKGKEYDLDKLEKQLESYFSESQRYFSQFFNIQRYKVMSLKMLLLIRKEQHMRSPEVVSRVKAIIEDPLLQNESEVLSERARIFYFQTLFIREFSEGNHLESYRLAYRIVDLMESNSWIIEERPENYLTSFQNMIMVSTLVLTMDKAVVEIRRLRNFASRLPHIKFDKKIEEKTVTMALNMELILYLRNEMIEEGLEILPRIREHLEKGAEFVNVNDGFIRLSLCSNAASLYFLSGDYESARPFISKLLQERSISDQFEIFLSARVMWIILLYETGDIRTMEYALISLYRFLRRRNKPYLLEKAMLRFIRESSGVKNDRQLKGKLREVKAELIKLREKEGVYRSYATDGWIHWLASRADEV